MDIRDCLSRRSLLAALFMLAATASTAPAADEPQVLVELAPKKIYEGESVHFRVLLNHVDEGIKPDLSGFVDFDVESIGTQPVDSTRVISINGRTQRVVRRGTLYEYALTPKKTGTLTIPTIAVKVDGKTYRGEALTLEVVPAAEQDTAILELKLSRREVYPMQPFDITLTIAVKPVPAPHADTDPLSVQDPPVQLSIPWADDEQLPDGVRAKIPYQRWLQKMLSQHGGFLINGEPANTGRFGMGGFASSFFSDVFKERSAAFLPPLKRAVREDHAGKHWKYFEYTLQRTFYADKIGEFSLGPVTLKGVFGTRVDTRGQLQGEPVYAFTKPVSIRVKDVPQQGRPASYVGAVGTFQVGAELLPREAKVGDPMTLTVWLQGEGTLDNALAPKLDTMHAIADNFKVYEATEETRNDRRIFTYGVRPRNAKVAELPPIELSYFDVNEEKFVTLQTDPIPIKVDEADRLADSDIAIASPAPRGNDGLEARTEGIFANATDVRQLRDESVRPDRWFLSLGGLTGLFVVIAVIAQRTQRRRDDVALQRRRGALRAARGKLQGGLAELAAGHARDGAEFVATALIGLVADVSDSAVVGQTSSDAVAMLQRLGIDDKLVERLRSLLQACDDARYAGGQRDWSNFMAEAEQTFQDLVRTLKSKRLLS